MEGGTKVIIVPSTQHSTVIITTTEKLILNHDITSQPLVSERIRLTFFFCP